MNEQMKVFTNLKIDKIVSLTIVYIFFWLKNTCPLMRYDDIEEEHCDAERYPPTQLKFMLRNY